MKKIMKKIVDLFIGTRWIYLVMAILFFITAYNKNEFYFWANYFSIGFFCVSFSIIGIVLHEFRKKKKS